MWKRWSRRTSAIPALEEDKTKGPTLPNPTAANQDSTIQASSATGITQQSRSVSPALILAGQIGDKLDSHNGLSNPASTPENHLHDTAEQSESAAPAVDKTASSPDLANTIPFDAPALTEAVSSFPATPSLTDNVGSPDVIATNLHGPSSATISKPIPTDTLNVPSPESPESSRRRRLSFRSLAFFYGRDKQPFLSFSSSNVISQTKERPASGLITSSETRVPRSQKEAWAAAVTLRTLIIGPVYFSSGEARSHTTAVKLHRVKSTMDPPSSSLKKVKAQLLKPKCANAIISQLRRLPLPDGPSFHVPGRASSESLVTHPDAGGAPIHAVCLACTDEEAETLHFSRLRTGHQPSPSSQPTQHDMLSPASSTVIPSVATANLESLIPVLKNLQIISLLASPDLGFGQPVSDDDNAGPLTGSIPSAGTILDGFEEITKQLMALGFATSKAVFPSHAGIYPPLDRMTVLTYWWGLEVVLPEPSVIYLGKAKSISGTLINFLSALALFNNGVREILPFIRYIANFVDFEWAAIKAQDKGQGVVCAATWVMPAAMVPRPWDFPPPPETIPNTPTAPKSSDKDNRTSPGSDSVAKSPVQQPDPATTPDVLYPVAPALPMMPRLMVTPATLPRHLSVPQETAP